MTENIKTSEVLIVNDLYPRSQLDTKRIQEYSENIEVLPPIELNQNNVLIDGAHRLSAFKHANVSEIPFTVTHTNSEAELFLLALKRNAIHGLQLSMVDKKRHAIKLCGAAPDDEIIKSLSIGARTYRDWTKDKRSQLKDERDDHILNLYLQCWTQQQIADELDITQQSISNVIDNFTNNGEIAKIGKDFKPFIYNIWNIPKQDNETSHFGAFPQAFMENLLYYYTQPFDVVIDPFGGSGTTIDMCKKWYRRYFVSDIKPTEISLQKGMREHDILNGIPKEAPKANFVFIDPPYWKQAENKYTELKNDFGNMALPDFYTHIEVLFKNVHDRLIENGHVAFVIQNTQWLNDDKHVEPHSHKLWNMAEGIGFKFVNLVHLPYSTQQYNAQQVEYAKEHNLILELNRELVIFGM